MRCRTDNGHACPPLVSVPAPLMLASACQHPPQTRWMTGCDLWLSPLLSSADDSHRPSGRLGKTVGVPSQRSQSACGQMGISASTEICSERKILRRTKDTSNQQLKYDCVRRNSGAGQSKDLRADQSEVGSTTHPRYSTSCLMLRVTCNS